MQSTTYVFCRSASPLYFLLVRIEYVVIEHNIAFDYNGEQHYGPVDFAGKGIEWAKKQFQLTKNRDKSKIEYCHKNKIPIIIIPYWEKDNIESFIIFELNLNPWNSE